MSTALDAHLDTIREYQEINTQIAELRERQATLRARIEDALGDDDTGTILGVPVITWKWSKPRRLDQKALKAAHPEIVEAFTVTTETRTFKVA